MAKLLQHHFDVEGFDVPDLPATEKGFECTQRIFVVFLRVGHDVVFVAFKPHVGPFLKGIDHIHLNALGLGALVRFGLVFDFFLSLAIKAIKNRIIIEGERVKFLAKVSVNIDIRTGEVSFALPDFGLGFKETIIESGVWESCKNDLIKGQDIWGMVELGYRAPDDFDIEFEYEKRGSKAKSSKDGKIKLISFKNFCPYNIDVSGSGASSHCSKPYRQQGSGFLLR